MLLNRKDCLIMKNLKFVFSTILTLLLILLCQSNSFAEPCPEFQVNTTTAEHQSCSVVASNNIGYIVVVWQSYMQDGDGYGIFAQKVRNTGEMFCNEFQVNTISSYSQERPAVAANASFEFMIVWEESDGDKDIYGRYYDYLGLGSNQFQINTSTEGDQEKPSVGIDDAGRFIVTWQGPADGGGNSGIFARRFSQGGTPVDDYEFQVSSCNCDNHYEPIAAMNEDGDYIITWYREDQDGSGYGIFAKSFKEFSDKGIEFQVNEQTQYDQTQPSVAIDEDDYFVITWESDDNNDNYHNVYYKMFDPDLVPFATDTLVNTVSTSGSKRPTVSLDNQGDFLITWHSDGQDGSNYGVYHRRYDGNRANRTITPLSANEILVNATTYDSQMMPTTAMDIDGDCIITWTSFDQDGGGAGVYAQRYFTTCD